MTYREREIHRGIQSYIDTVGTLPDVVYCPASDAVAVERVRPWYPRVRFVVDDTFMARLFVQAEPEHIH
ncbi:MAG: hypothetical protein GVY18_18700 [Bacteroidetes bacterium]|jgi:hypothetical protein|nr:hypothetical protein [Bacteroidota bacterium]